MANHFQFDRVRPFALTAVLALGTSIQAQAISFHVGEIEGQFDSSLSIGSSWALRNPDSAYVGTWNGGHASSQSADDGRMKKKKLLH